MSVKVVVVRVREIQDFYRLAESKPDPSHSC